MTAGSVQQGKSLWQNPVVLLAEAAAAAGLRTGNTWVVWTVSVLLFLLLFLLPFPFRILFFFLFLFLVI